MEVKEARAALEALLFASGTPISAEKLAQALQLDRETVSKVAQNLADELDARQSGLCVVRMGEEYQLCSRAAHAEVIRRALEIRRNTPLSQAAMEVLAVVAYTQPVTKAFVEQVRGVDCSGVMGSLCAKGLLEEKGRLELPGRPLLYGTTPDFLRCFGFSSLDELPPLPDRREDGEQEEAENGEESDG